MTVKTSYVSFVLKFAIISWYSNNNWKGKTVN